MTENESNFKKWHVDVLEALYRMPDTGFAQMFIAFPILERLNGICEKRVGSLTRRESTILSRKLC